MDIHRTVSRNFWAPRMGYSDEKHLEDEAGRQS